MCKTIPPATRIALLVLAMLFPTFITSLYFVFLSGGDGKPNLWQQAVYLGGKAVQFMFPIVFVLFVDRRFPWPKAPHFAGLGWGLAFGLAIAGSMLSLYYGWLGETWLFAESAAKVQEKLREVNMLSPTKYIVMAAVIVAVHSLAEEYYWRWFVFAQLNRLMNLPLAITLSSIAFMGHHFLLLAGYFPGRWWSAIIPFSMAIAIGGAFWAWLFSRTQTIYSAWLSHALVDAAIFVICWDLLERVGW